MRLRNTRYSGWFGVGCSAAVCTAALVAVVMGCGGRDEACTNIGCAQEQAASIVTEVRAELNPELGGHVGI